MRYGIFADIHSNLEALEAVLAAYKNQAIDKYLCVGDIVGYATNPNECVESIRTLCAVKVAGNHDWGCVDLFREEYFNPFAKEAVIWTKKELSLESRFFLESLESVYKNEDLTLVHGTLDSPKEFEYMSDLDSAYQTFRLLETNICFVAHTHVPVVFIRDSEDQFYSSEANQMDIKDGLKYIVNVGSVGQPRDGDARACFSIYDTQKKTIEIKRALYNFEATAGKILDAGLPKFLAQRLAIGR